MAGASPVNAAWPIPVPCGAWAPPRHVDAEAAAEAVAWVLPTAVEGVAGLASVHLASGSPRAWA